MDDFFLDHKNMGICKVCGEPIWATVEWGSGVYPHNLCWECARKFDDVEIIRFDYCKVTPEDNEEYRKYCKKHNIK